MPTLSLISNPSHKKSILIVDDNQFNRNKLKQNLMNILGARVEFVLASDGLYAIDESSKKISSSFRNFDVAFMDEEMAIVHGKEATEAIRQLEELEKKIELKSYIIAWSTVIDSENLYQGANASLPKTCMTDEIIPELIKAGLAVDIEYNYSQKLAEALKQILNIFNQLEIFLLNNDPGKVNQFEHLKQEALNINCVSKVEHAIKYAPLYTQNKNDSIEPAARKAINDMRQVINGELLVDARKLLKICKDYILQIQAQPESLNNSNARILLAQHFLKDTYTTKSDIQTSLEVVQNGITLLIAPDLNTVLGNKPSKRPKSS